MVINKLLIAINGALNGLLNSFFKGGIVEEDLLKTLNESIYYNLTYQQYIFEMLFIQALEMGRVPRSITLLSMLFKNCSPEDYLIPETYNQEGTRMRVLKQLGLSETIRFYELYLIRVHPEQHTLFREGIRHPKLIEANDRMVTLEMIRNQIILDLEIEGSNHGEK